jgi:hypothetical protein
MPYQRYVLD